MPEALRYGLALLLLVAGLAWLALAMERHWQQVHVAAPSRAAVMVLRGMGSAALLLSLALCLSLDHASIAVLVWVMALVPAALAVTFTLSWRPEWLAPLLLRMR